VAAFGLVEAIVNLAALLGTVAGPAAVQPRERAAMTKSVTPP
jgi:hypothetical protein